MGQHLAEPWAATMSTLEAEVAIEEGYRAHIYRCSAGKLTIGYGLNLSSGLPKDEALVLMRYRLAKILRELSGRLPWFDGISHARQRALVSMAYQMGVGGVLEFKKMIAAAQDGDWAEASRQALDSKWARHDSPARAMRIAGMLREG